MSILQAANLKSANSKKYREIISNIYYQFENLYKLMDLYNITESMIYLELAYKCFEKEVAADLEGKKP